MESSPAGVQSSSGMGRPAAVRSLLPVHLPLSGAPRTRPMQFKLSDCPSLCFHHIQCLFWQRDREQLLEQELQLKQINPSSFTSRLVASEEDTHGGRAAGHASILHPQTCCPSGCQSLITLLVINLRF